MANRVRLMLILVAAIVASVPAGGQTIHKEFAQTYSECRELNQRKESRNGRGLKGRDVHTEEALESLGFLGFCVDDGQDGDLVKAAKRGLNNIYSAGPFRGAAFPLALRPKLDQILSQAPATPSGIIDTGTIFGAYEVFGSIPSPNSRPGVSLGSMTIKVPKVGDSVSVYKGAVGTQSNCFSCHSGVIDGRLLAGAMNTQLDQNNLMIALGGLVKARVHLLAENDRQFQLGSLTAKIERQVFETYLNRATRVWIPAFSQCRGKGDKGLSLSLRGHEIWGDSGRWSG